LTYKYIWPKRLLNQSILFKRFINILFLDYYMPKIEYLKERGYHIRKRLPGTARNGKPNRLGYLHVYIWEKAHKKKLPSGWVIHHIDGNAKNNKISNLQAMQEWDHQLIHQNYFLNKKTKASIRLGRLIGPGQRIPRELVGK